MSEGSPLPAVQIVAAVAENGVIGVEGGLPWKLPNDLKRFKQLTWGHPILMGRRTWESIGKPLPGRRSLVITRATLDVPGVETAPSLPAALEACRGTATVFVIGGARLYAEALPLARILHLTIVHGSPPGDTWFPEFDPAAWRVVEETTHPSDARHAYAYTFRELAREAVP